MFQTGHQQAFTWFRPPASDDNQTLILLDLPDPVTFYFRKSSSVVQKSLWKYESVPKMDIHLPTIDVQLNVGINTLPETFAVRTWTSAGSPKGSFIFEPKKFRGKLAVWFRESILHRLKCHGCHGIWYISAFDTMISKCLLPSKKHVWGPH